MKGGIAVAGLILTIIFGVVAYEQLALDKKADERALKTHLDVEAKLLPDQRQPKVQVWTKNNGETVAKQVAIKARCYWREIRSSDSAPEYRVGAMQVPEGTPTDLVPDQEIFVEYPVDPRGIAPLRNKEVSLHADVELRWVDSDGLNRVEWCRFVQGGDYDPLSPVMGRSVGEFRE